MIALLPLVALLAGTGGGPQPVAMAAAPPAGAAPAVWLTPAPAPAFDDWFLDRTMRLEYHHTGGMGDELVAAGAVVSDGPWAGSRARLLDDLGLGTHRFEVRDAATGTALYSRGFSSLMAEWLTTAEAADTHRTFGGSLRFPWPRRPVRVVIEQRVDGDGWEELWSGAVDPADPAVTAAEADPAGEVWAVMEHGPVADKVDLLLIGEGYPEAQDAKFRGDVRRLVDALFREEPFRSRRADFNVRALRAPAAEPGVNRPQSGIFRRTPTGVTYNVFGSERYMLSVDDHALRDVAAAAPYEFVAILANDAQYGGGGIYNDHAAVAVDTEFAEYVFVHEFGHHFAGLGDEYYTSDVAYLTGAEEQPEPWAPNVTALHDPATLKWRDLVTPGTPLPTPWDKRLFDQHAVAVQAQRRRLIQESAPEAAFDALFRDQREWETGFLSTQAHAGEVGAFEGAMYESRGLYRPEVDCLMFTRDEVGFCAVCRRAIAAIIDQYSRA